MAHPYCSSLDKFEEMYPEKESVSVFVEIYPSKRMHYEALTEFCMIGDLYKRDYKDITIFLKSWNIDEKLSEGENDLESVTERKWMQSIKSFLFRRYGVPPNTIKTKTPDNLFKKLGNEATIDFFIDFFIDSEVNFTTIGKAFAEQEYWPWDELKEKSSDEYDEKARREGKLSYVGLRYITSEAQEDKTGKQYVIMRPASTREMTEKMTEKIFHSDIELRGIHNELKQPEIFYTDNDVSRRENGKNSFLRDALEQSRHWRRDEKKENTESNNILNHFDSDCVINAVVEALLNRWVGRDKLIFEGVGRNIKRNQQAVIEEFKYYRDLSLQVPTSTSSKLFGWMLEYKKELRELADTYSRELQKEKKENEKGGMEEGGFFPCQPLKGSVRGFVFKIRNEFRRGESWGFDEDDKKLIEANIIKIEREPTRGRRSGRKGDYYKVKLDRLKVVFLIYESMDLKQ